MYYRFGDLEFDSGNLQLRRGEILIPLEPKAYEVLELLIQHRDRVVRKQEVLRTVWQDVRVSEASLRRVIRDLRRALGDEGKQESFIATRHGIGYQFIADVTELPASAATAKQSELVSAPAGKDSPLPDPSREQHYSSLRNAPLLNFNSVTEQRRQSSGEMSESTQSVQSVFLDIPYLLALTLRDHPLHLRALELSGWLQSEFRPLVTTEHVLETVRSTLTYEFRLADVADRLYDLLAADPAVQIIPVTQDLLSEVIHRYWGAAKQDFTGMECTSFVVMELQKATEALTDNENFERAGFRALLRTHLTWRDSLRTVPSAQTRWLPLYLLPLLFLSPFAMIVTLERFGGEQSALVKAAQSQPAVTIGIPVASLIASYAVLFIRPPAREASLIEVLGMRLPNLIVSALIWIGCFLVVVLAVFLLWRAY